jgi:hypothetical protein
MADTKEHAHELIDRLPPAQLAAVVGLLEAILDPVSRAIAKAPPDDEQESAQERRDVAASKAWLERSGGPGISHDEVLAHFGLTPNISRNSKNKREKDCLDRSDPS